MREMVWGVCGGVKFGGGVIKRQDFGVTLDVIKLLLDGWEE